MTAPEHPEVVWQTSTLSANGADCVQVAAVESSRGQKISTSRLFLIRDSKNIDGGTLTFTPSEWHAFIGGVRNGEFDDLT